MVSEISGVASSYSVSSQPSVVGPQRGLAPVQSDPESKPGTSVPQATASRSSSDVTGVYSQLQDRQDELNKAASFLREAGSTLDKAAKTLDAMGKDLGQIVKMYPPYPLDSPQRIALLNKLSGLRREIDALTFPPPEHFDALGRLLAGEDGKTGKSPMDGKSYPGSDAISGIPELNPKTASDKTVSQAFDQVKALKSVVEDIRSGMWNDVLDYVRQADTPASRDHAAETRDQLASLGFGQGIATDAQQLQHAVESN